jgi:hypothetical protein
MVSAQLDALSLLLLPLLIGLSIASRVLAKALAESKPKGGCYWQKIEKSNGIRNLYRTQTEAKIQNAAQCSIAGAVKP